jgi:hypothetical protein
MACPVPALAEEATNRPVPAVSTDEVRDTLVKAGVGREADVMVTLRDRSVVTGRIDYVGKHSLFVVDGATGRVTQVPYGNLSQVQAWSPGYKTKIALAAGVVATMILILLIKNMGE